MTGDRDEKFVSVFGIDYQLRDLLTVAEPEMRPRLAGVSRFINAVADRKIRPVQSFAASDVDNVRI